MVELDFTDLAPDTAPDQEQVKRAVSEAERISVAGPVCALGAVLAALRRQDRLDVGVSWIPSGDPLASGLSRTWGVDAGGRLSEESSRTLGMVCDDRGGVLLARGRITAARVGAMALGGNRTGSRFGAQIYHDDKRVADGQIMRVDVRPDWTAEDSLKVNVHKQLWRRGEITGGRALQVACDEVQIEIDGVPLPRPMTKWTWYADPRLRWTLISA